MSDRPLVSERHFFLEGRNKSTYCVEYMPDTGGKTEKGVILCKPIWGERIRTHRIFTNLGRMLASHGFAVITCDYYGDGNSGGETQDLTYPGMVNDITRMYDHLRGRYNPTSITLAGFRVGASCAISANSQLPEVKKTILIEPLLNIIDYLKDALRANLTSQMALHKKIVKTREELIGDLKQGIPLNIDGFIVGRKLWESFESASPLKINGSLKGPFVVFSLVDKRGRGADYTGLVRQLGNARLEQIVKEFVWNDWKYYVPSPPIFFDRIMQEISSDRDVSHE
jgi:alpha/beta superfamily hydrolase